ncbi:Rieske (2Fe-2S) protein [Nonomuraea cavernae]|uniref:Rieske (2Fe-2S) protein n=1 Tax=Nonomuraea cavernae TaxID=2045107 RepID=UPI0033ED2F89
MADDLQSRRAVIAGVGAGGLALALTACGADTDTPSNAAATGPAEPGAAGGALGRTTDIPVGGGTVFKDRKIVVTQPTAGDFKAYTAICTHQGCTVASVANGLIECPCHGGKYKIEDGSVAGGPPKGPLAETAIKVEGDQITLA